MRHLRIAKICFYKAVVFLFVFSFGSTYTAASSVQRIGAAGDSGRTPEVFLNGELKEPIKVTYAEFMDLSGKRLSAKDFNGQVLVIAFWAPWNLESVALLKELQSLREELYGIGNSQERVTFLPISYTQVGALSIESFCENYDIGLPVYYDEEEKLFDYFAVKSVPLVLVVDKNGYVTHRVSGSMKWDSTDMVRTILSIAEQ